MCQIEKKDFSKLFQSTKELEVPETSKVQGNLPNWLRGTILRVGPGNWDFDGFTVNHYLDGYAILSQFEISDGCVAFHKKFLQSDAYKRAVRAQKPVVIEFGTRAYPDTKGRGLFQRIMAAIMPEMSDNNSSNIFQFGKDFFVSNDACYFRRIDHKSLESLERYDTNKLFGLNGWTSHPQTDTSGNTYNIGFHLKTFYIVKIPPTSMCQNIKEAFRDAKILCSIPSSYYGGISFLHSFGISLNYIIMVEQPYVASFSTIAMTHIKGHSVKEWMKWIPKHKNRFHIIDKTGKVLKTEFWSDKPFFFLHFVNCFENKDNQIVVDVIAFDDPAILDGMYLCKLRNNVVENAAQATCRRFVIPLSFPKDLPEGGNAIDETRSLAKALRHGEDKFTLTCEVLTDAGCEMPTINRQFSQKTYNYFYVSGTIAKNSFSHSISKIDLHRRHVHAWNGGENLYPGEPLFVSNPNNSNSKKGEDDGIIISCVYDVEKNHKDFLIFLDAKSMQEIARVEFGSHIPGALHGIFIPSNAKVF